MTEDVENPLAVFKMISVEVEELFKSEELLEQLKQIKFDLFFHGTANHAILLNNYLQIPTMIKVFDVQPDASL